MPLAGPEPAPGEHPRPERPRHAASGPGARRGTRGWSRHPATAEVLLRDTDPARLEEAAYVLRAMGIEHEIRGRRGDQILLVPAEDALRAADQLRRYDEENRRGTTGPRRRAPPLQLARARAGLVFYGVLLGTCFVAQQRRVGGLDWEQAGLLVPRAVREGELWRAVTALTLHADVPHLVGNLVFGAGFGFFVAQLLGNGLGWSAVLAAGAVANLAEALLRPAGRSLGASTAVFAAVGLLVAASLRLHGRFARGRLQRWAPLVLGVALLGYLGTGGPRTDVLGHLLGFVSGILLGLPVMPLAHRRPGPWIQAALGLASLAAVAGCWWRALG